MGTQFIKCTQPSSQVLKNQYTKGGSQVFLHTTKMNQTLSVWYSRAQLVALLAVAAIASRGESGDDKIVSSYDRTYQGYERSEIRREERNRGTDMEWEVCVSKINGDELGEFQRGKYVKTVGMNILAFGSEGEGMTGIIIVPECIEKTKLYKKEVSRFTKTEGIPEGNVCRYLYQNGEDHVLIITSAPLEYRRRLTQTPFEDLA